MTSEHTKSITTSIPTNLWRTAVLHEIRWCDAIKLGIEATLDLQDKEEKELLTEKDKLIARMRFIDTELGRLKKEKEENKKKNKERVVIDFGDITQNG